MSTPVEKILRNLEGETITLGSSFKSVDTVSILVVDDDTTCLAIVAAILKKFHYEVVTVKHPRDALCTLRIKSGAFDLVVTDVHMPDMNGFELQQAISQEFDLPVVLMSADDKEGVVLKGLDGGAAFFIAKPVTPDDLKDLWQFAAMKKKSDQVVIEEEKSSQDKHKSDEKAATASSINEDKSNKKLDSKKKSPRKEGPDEKKGGKCQSSKKKPKVVWNNGLHNRFLEAIRSIGLERAVPKKILEVMNVPGLTRENVASHLQKYRIFLRRVSDASYQLHYSNDHKGLRFTSRSYKPSYTSLSSGRNTTSSIYNFNRFSRLHSQNPGIFPRANSTGSFLNQGVSSLLSQSRFGQSRLLSNRGTFLRSNIGPTSLMSTQSNRAFDRFAQNQGSTSIQGHLSNTSSGLSSIYNPPIRGSTGINLSGGYEFPYQKSTIGTSSSAVSSVPAENFKYTTNYVGYKISNLKHLLGKKRDVDFKSTDDGAIKNVPSEHDHESQKSNNVSTAAAMVNDSAINLDQLVKLLEGSVPSSPFNSDIAADEKELSDVIADYQMLLPSNVPLQENLENGGEINIEDAYSPMFDFSEFDIIPSPLPLEEDDINSSFPDQVNIQNQGEQNGGENVASSGFYGGAIHWDNSVPSFNQAPNLQQQQQQGHNVFSISQEFGILSQLSTTPPPNINEQQGQKSFTNYVAFSTTPNQLNKTVKSPTHERADDDFLESLLAPSPYIYAEDQSLEGI